MHKVDTAFTAAGSTYIAAHTVQPAGIIPGDPSGEMTKLILSILIGFVTPLLQGLIKKLFNKTNP